MVIIAKTMPNHNFLAILDLAKIKVPVSNKKKYVVNSTTKANLANHIHGNNKTTIIILKTNKGGKACRHLSVSG